MTARLSLTCDSMMLYTGRRSLYLALAVGRHRWYIQRWDTARCPANRFRSGDMGWSWGHASP